MGCRCPPTLSNLSHSFEASRGGSATACRNHITVGIEDVLSNSIGERVVANNLDGPREP